MERLIVVLFVLLVGLLGCGGGTTGNTKAINAEETIAVRIVVPTCDTVVVSGAEVDVAWEANGSVDSCQIFIGAKRQGAYNGVGRVTLSIGTELGVQSVRVIAWQEGKSREAMKRVTVLSATPPTLYGYRVKGVYPHDTGAYTQGLLFHEGFLYESTGQYGASELRKVCIVSGKVLKERKLDNAEFGEGLALHNATLYQLTWTSHCAHRYELETFEPAGDLYYSTQGWGLASDGESLYMTDGTENIYVLDPYTFRVIRTVQAYTHEGPQRMLNELEFIDGLLYANIYLTDEIVAIHPSTGAVARRIHMSGLLPQKERTPRVEVLNGIAYDAERQAIYLTGKYWPKLYHVEFVAK